MATCEQSSTHFRSASSVGSTTPCPSLRISTNNLIIQSTCISSAVGIFVRTDGDCGPVKTNILGKPLDIMPKRLLGPVVHLSLRACPDLPHTRRPPPPVFILSNPVAITMVSNLYSSDPTRSPWA